MLIKLNRNSTTPLYLQINNQISNMIIEGLLPQNYILPSERSLAEELNINRSTVIRAYMELKAEGLVESRVGKGTVILLQEKSLGIKNKYIADFNWDEVESCQIVSTNSKYIKQILELVGDKRAISFAGGISSLDTYPMTHLKEIQEGLIDKYNEKLFMPTCVYGCLELRKSIKELMKIRGVKASLNEIMILSGSQQSIDYLSKIMLEQGDVVIVEEPTYLGAIEIFKAANAKVVGVPIDKYGINLDILETYLIKYRPKFIYIQPNFQNPSGITMSLEKRKKLLELAYFYKVPILEDDAYGDIRYEGINLPSLKALDTHNYVVYICTFSKILFSGFRIGWIVANENIIKRCGDLKQLTDLHANTYAQYVLCEFIDRGYYKIQLNNVSDNYRKKRDLMVKEILKYKIEGIEFEIPEGGYYLWCRLPDNVKVYEFINNTKNAGIAVLPGDIFYPNGMMREMYIRINFTYPSEEEIIEGVKRLVKLIKKSLDKSNVMGEFSLSVTNPVFVDV